MPRRLRACAGQRHSLQIGPNIRSEENPSRAASPEMNVRRKVPPTATIKKTTRPEFFTYRPFLLSDYLANRLPFDPFWCATLHNRSNRRLSPLTPHKLLF